MKQQGELGRAWCGERMPLEKIEAFFEEFPWVLRYVDGQPVKRVYVSRIEPAFLDYKPLMVSMGKGGYYLEDIFLLDKDGKGVVREVEEIVYHRKYFLFGPRVGRPEWRRIGCSVSKDTTVGNSLCSLKTEAEKVCFALSYCKYTEAVIIYKSPKGFSIPGWIKQKIAAEVDAFRKECVEIDAEAARLSM